MVDHLPRGEAIAFSEMIDHVLERLVLGNVHIIADISLSIPLIDQFGRHCCCRLEMLWVEVNLGRSVRT